jgi:O-antigen/teichoic acid export membrane protein
MRLVKGTTLAFGGSVLGNSSLYLFGLFVARALGAEGVGYFFLGLVLMQAVSAVSRIGLPDGLLRFVSIHHSMEDHAHVRGSIRTASFIVLGISAVAGFCLYLFSEFLSTHIFKQTELALYIRWFSLILPLFSVFVLLTNAVQALKRIDFVVLSRDVIQPVIMFVLALLIFPILPNATAFLLSYGASVLAGLFAILLFLKQESPSFFKSSSVPYDWKPLLMFSLPITLSDLAHYLFRWMDTFLLSIYRSPAEVGIYNAALRTTLLLSLFAVSVNALYAPIIADHFHHGRKVEIEALSRTLIRWSVTIAIPIVFIMSILSKEILLFWGPEFLIASKSMIILSFGQLLFVISAFLAFTLLMDGQNYLEVGNTIAVVVLNVFLNIILIQGFGITGAAISMLCAQTFGLALRWLEVQNLCHIRLYTSNIFKPLLALIPVSFLVVGIYAFISDPLYLGAPTRQIVSIGFIPIITAVGYLVGLYIVGIEEDDLLVIKGFIFERGNIK